MSRTPSNLSTPSSSDEHKSVCSNVQSGTMMEVSIISKENIKPSTPTPIHLKTYKLSCLDQLFPHIYVPMVFFYSNNNPTSLNEVVQERSEKLKQSLSQILSYFYPFAGMVKDDLQIECNDNGVYYIETKVNKSLSSLLNHPTHHLIHKLLPYDPNSSESLSRSYALMIQVNFFICGGMAISFCTSHKIIDGPTCMAFFKAWAKIASGSLEQLDPSFVAPSLFPQNPLLPKGSSLVMWPAMFKQGKCVTRRLVFDAPALIALKAKASYVSSSNVVQNPSRVLAVTTLIWKCATTASRRQHGSLRPSVLSLAVNLRRQSVPHLPEFSVGNLLWSAVTRLMPNEKLDLKSVARILKNSIGKINGDFVNQIKGDQGCHKVKEELKVLGEIYSNYGADYFAATSVCNSGLYEANFGWGKPIWSCIGNPSANTPHLANLIFLIDTKQGNGIEAWVTLSEHDMAIFETDPELLLFASLDPSPLNISVSPHPCL